MIRFKKDDGSNYPQLMEKMLGDIYQFQYGQFNNNPDNGGNILYMEQMVL